MHFLLLIVSLFIGCKVFSQPTSMTQTTRDRINFSGLTIPQSGVLYGLSGDAGQLLGTAYLDSTWQAGTVTFYTKLLSGTDSLTGVPVRYDLKAGNLEIRAKPGDVRVAKESTVRQFRVNNLLGGTSHYINVHEFGSDAAKLTGFVEQVVSGQLTLLCYPSVYLKRANYNAALSTGSKDDVLIPRTDWYVAQNGHISRLSLTRKAILALMADKKDEIDRFISTADPDLKTRAGLISVFSHYNALH